MDNVAATPRIALLACVPRAPGMSRHPRFSLTGSPLQFVQCGNDRGACFFGEAGCVGAETTYPAPGWD
jgi:hypothetical protein